MTDKYITQYDAETAPASTDAILIDQGGGAYKYASILNLLAGTGSKTINGNITINYEATFANNLIINATKQLKLGNSILNTGYFLNIKSDATNDGFIQCHNGATSYLTIDGTGKISWQGDTNIYRTAANTLKTDDSLEVAGNFIIPDAGITQFGSSYGTGTYTIRNGATNILVLDIPNAKISNKLKIDAENGIAFPKQIFAGGVYAQKAIAGGTVAVDATKGFLGLTGEGDVADSLDNITGATAGEEILLTNHSGTYNITLVYSGSLRLKGATNATLTGAPYVTIICLMYTSGGFWVELWRNF